MQALVMRLEGLRAEGRRVVLVGDYNITYDPKDHCEPGPNFIDGRVDRQMLLGLLPPRGPFLDTFRVFQPDRSHLLPLLAQAHYHQHLEASEDFESEMTVYCMSHDHVHEHLSAHIELWQMPLKLVSESQHLQDGAVYPRVAIGLLP